MAERPDLGCGIGIAQSPIDENPADSTPMSPTANDDDRTVQAGMSVPGAVPGSGGPFGSAANASGADHLPLGVRLGEFEITGYVGEGGFSIVYLAWDHSLERRVALKEYMPSSLAARNGGTQVIARSERHRETFDAGLKSFINEGKLLAQFDHPSLVKVYRFWEAHGTAYMVMPFYEGVTLKDAVRSLGQPPDEAWLRKLLEPLTAALSVIHEAQCYHRDIAPDNVMLLASSGKPLLLDFGAARRVIGDRTQALTVILKPGYAPVEQYAEDPGMKQGPWTDVYALAAVVYWCVTGKTPPTSVGRLLNDSYVPLAHCAAGRYDANFLAALDRALLVLPEQRTRTIERLRDELGLGRADAQHNDKTVAWSDPDATVIRPLAHAPSAAPAAVRTSTAAPDGRLQDPAAIAPRSVEQRHATERSWRALGLAGTVLLFIIVGAVWWLTRAPDTTVARSEAKPEIKASAQTGTNPDPAQQQPAPPVTPATAADALGQLMGARDSAMTLTATHEPPRGNLVRLQVTASEPGYAYVVGLLKDRNELVIVAPPPGRPGGKLGTSSVLDVPVPAAVGVVAYHVIWAREPRDLPAANWSMRSQVWVREFGAGNMSAPPAPTLGSAQCAPSAPTCDPAYGMTDVSKVTDATLPPPSLEGKDGGGDGGVRGAAGTRKDEPKGPRIATPSTEAKAAPKRDSRVSAECQEILVRMSLGSANQQDIEKLKTLRCGS